MSRVLSLALAAALAAAAVQPAQAAAPVNKAKVRKVLQDAGLIGFWAVDCSKAPSSDNPWETLIVDPEGYVMDGDYEARTARRPTSSRRDAWTPTTSGSAGKSPWASRS